MSEAVEKCMDELIRAIKESPECTEFERYRDQLSRFPELWQKAQDFRRRVFLLQSSNEPVDRLQETDLMFKDRMELRKTKLIADYLDAELRLCRMLQKVSVEIMTVTELELDTLRDVIGI